MDRVEEDGAKQKGFKGAEKGRRSASSQGWLEGEGLQRMVGKEGQSDRGKRVPVSKDGWQRRLASAMKRCVLIQKGRQ